MSTSEQQAAAIADQVIPQYRNGKRSYSCGSHTAKRWEAAYEGALAVLRQQPADPGAGKATQADREVYVELRGIDPHSELGKATLMGWHDREIMPSLLILARYRSAALTAGAKAERDALRG